MKLGIVGLPNCGKTTLFNALTGSQAQTSAYPYTTVETNLAAVTVPDSRLSALAAMHNPKKITHATAEFCDLAGLAPGAARGEGLGNRFLAGIREVDAVLHVLRCFGEDGDILRDKETVDIELCVADVETLDKRIARAEKAAKGDKSYLREAELLGSLRARLDSGLAARGFPAAPEDTALLASCQLLTAKPVLYCVNFSEELYRRRREYKPLQALEQAAAAEGAAVFPICAATEWEISRMAPEDRALFLEDIGETECAGDRLIRLCYELMGLISFLTAGPPEVRAWTIRKGAKAPDAAGKIHNDIRRGFIRAEVTAFGDLMACGSPAAAKEKGLTRVEGREYVMRDGDVVLFRFNV
ncbi:MAG: redox-regulated ATPase YchF [Oscillospiraceae bacterium]|jgi:GTP-binding protein YchF|nr:redox-regulated ATPase YchF [Oscillospiraceae bacterium]